MFGDGLDQTLARLTAEHQAEHCPALVADGLEAAAADNVRQIVEDANILLPRRACEAIRPAGLRDKSCKSREQSRNPGKDRFLSAVSALAECTGHAVDDRGIEILHHHADERLRHIVLPGPTSRDRTRFSNPASWQSIAWGTDGLHPVVFPRAIGSILAASR